MRLDIQRRNCKWSANKNGPKGHNVLYVHSYKHPIEHFRGSWLQYSGLHSTAPGLYHAPQCQAPSPYWLNDWWLLLTLAPEKRFIRQLVKWQCCVPYSLLTLIQFRRVLATFSVFRISHKNLFSRLIIFDRNVLISLHNSKRSVETGKTVKAYICTYQWYRLNIQVYFGMKL
jgi:hypothetical protein